MNASGIEYLWVCQAASGSRSRGFFYGDKVFNYPTPTVLAQLSLASLLFAFTQYVLNPLGESAFISMMLVGFALGPTLWGDYNSILVTIFPVKSTYVTETFSFFGCVIYMFLVGIKMDMRLVRRTGKKAVIIGLFTFMFPLTLNLIVATILTKKMEMPHLLHRSIYYIAFLHSFTSFHVIVCLLADLKLLNSELGHVAASSSVISGGLCWIAAVVVFTSKQTTHGSEDSSVWMLVSAVLLLTIVFVVLRPVVLWMIRNTSQGKPVKEEYIISIFLMLLGCAFASEVVGQHVIFGAIVLGMAIPDGPPLGSALSQKLESFLSCVLLPSYFVYSVSGVNVLSIHTRTILVISIFGVSSCLGKVLGAMLPALYYKFPPVEALSLGLIMSCQGIADVLLLQHGLYLNVLDNQMYSIIVINMLLLSGTITPIIKMIYDPSRIYKTNHNRTIQHTGLNMEFRMLMCIYHQDSTPCLVSLLEVSNPTAKSSICCYVVHLVQLIGSLSPLLLYHKPERSGRIGDHYSNHIINAFRLYERQRGSNIIVNLFTCISPFETVHEEVCRLAVEKRASALIIPFHKQWRLHGIEDLVTARNVNRQILEKAPCSVGILVDRGTLAESKRKSLFNIGIIFVHGRDDREALAYGLRMARHPDVSITVIHVTSPEAGSRKYSLDFELDEDIIAEFKIANIGKKRHVYRREVAKDSIELIIVIRSIENLFDLLMVGRYHDNLTSMFTGLTEWNEFPELGFVGDVLASSDSTCQVSVLVVQSHTTERIDGVHNLLDDSAEAVKILCESTKGWSDIQTKHRTTSRK